MMVRMTGLLASIFDVDGTVLLSEFGKLMYESDWASGFAARHMDPKDYVRMRLKHDGAHERENRADQALFKATNIPEGVKFELMSGDLDAHVELDWSSGRVFFVKVDGHEPGIGCVGDYTNELETKPAKTLIGVEEYVSQAKIDTCCACDCSLESDENQFRRHCETCTPENDPDE